MNPLDALLTALGALRANPLRSALTGLGVVIGVASVVAMVSIGLGAQARIEQAITDIGSNMLVVGGGSRTSDGRRSGRGNYLTLTERDVAAMLRELPEIAVAAGSVRGTARLVAGNSNWYTHLWGVTPAFFPAQNWRVVAGRELNGADVRATAKVAMIGQSVARELFGDRPAVGMTLRIERVPFTVVGVLNPKGPDPWLGSDQDDLVLVPLSTAKRRIFGSRQARLDLVDQITVRAVDEAAVEAAETGIRRILRREHGLAETDPDDFFVSNVTESLNARSESSRVMGRLLASVAAISLLVGGIGIMNIMLVSVTERTREIGVRMALGARRRDILMQFVIEALVLASLGGLAGAALGAAGSVLIADLSHWQVQLGWGAMGLAVSFAALTGLVFGVYPAGRAARLDPMDALRSE